MPVFSFQKVMSNEEYQSVFPLLVALIAEEGNPFIVPPAYPEGLENWRRSELYGYELYMAKNESDVLGVMGVTRTYDPLESVPSMRINNFIVDPSHRGQGIGTAMMKEAEGLARQEGIKFILLEVLGTNDKAIKFYKDDLGYEYACNRMLKDVSGGNS